MQKILGRSNWGKEHKQKTRTNPLVFKKMYCLEVFAPQDIDKAKT